MSITPILEALTNLEKLHKSLLELSHKKTAIIKTGDMDGLDQLLKDEQAHIAAISQLESQRQQKVSEYLQAKGFAPAANPTVAAVVDVADKQEQIVALEQARNELLRTINDLKWQNDLNQKLTYQSLQFVNLSLDMLRPQPEQLNYSKTEISNAKKSKNQSFFDSQA